MKIKNKYFDIFKMNIILKHYLNINIILLLSFVFYALIYFHLLNVTFVFNLKYYIYYKKLTILLNFFSLWSIRYLSLTFKL